MKIVLFVLFLAFAFSCSDPVQEKVKHNRAILAEKNTELRINALRELGAIGISAARAQPDVIKCLNEKDQLLRIEAIMTLPLIAPQQREVEDVLLGATADAWHMIRARAAHGLGLIKSQRAAPFLIRLLDDPNRFVRGEAAQALARIGAKVAVRRLALALKREKDAEARVIIAAAAFRLEPTKENEAIFDGMLSSGTEEVRTLAQTLLVEQNRPKEKIIELIEQGLKDSSPSVRLAALENAARHGPEAGALLPLVYFIFTDDIDRVSHLSVKALLRIDPEGKELPGLLLKALVHKKARTRIWSAQGLARYEGQAGRIVPALVKLLSDPEAQVRQEGARSLGRLGLAAQAAIPALENLELKAGPESRAIIRGALQQIRGERSVN